MEKRVKGRDWYDVIWYIQNGIPLHLPHLEERMIQTHHLQPGEKLSKSTLLAKIHKKIDEIDWVLAKSDIALFIPDKKRLSIWSASFFHDLMDDLSVVNLSEA